MNWKQNLFKPKWQNKNPEIRLESVSTDQDPQLIGKLLEIAASDEDKRVRCAAIKRLHQLENILKLYDNEKEPSVRTLLEERIRQLTASTDDSRPALELRMQVAKATSNRDLIEHLAKHAPEAELRRAALARVERQGVLGDCCVHDSDAENRSFAASRITQHTTLKRVIDSLRKHDKALHADLKARLHKEQLAQHVPEAVETEALGICTSLERLALSAESPKPKDTAALHEAWQRIAEHTSPDMNDRYQRVCDRLAAPPAVTPVTSCDENTEAVPEIQPETTLKEETQAEHEDGPGANAALTQVTTDVCMYEAENRKRPKAAQVSKLKTRLEKTWKQCNQPSPEDQSNFDKANAILSGLEETIQKEIHKFEQDLDQARELLVQLEKELDEGELHHALETRLKLQQLGKGRGKNRDWQKINGKMSGMYGRLRELREWHHWSNNKIRKRLIAEMEVLPAADLHPDALLDRIKSLQAEWKSLEQSEQIPGDKHFAAAPWMWRKFNAAGHAAFDTVKPYLEKRSEIQSRHAQSLATFCAELEQLAAADPMDWTALSKGMNRGRKKLRDLNSVPANKRQKFAKKLKGALDRANAVMQEHYKVVEVEKMKLIRAASQLIHLPERGEAIAQAKALQSDWKTAGSLWRSREQKLWNEFRAHLDPLFEELKEQQADLRAADEEKLNAQKELCASLQGILDSGDDLASQHGRVQGLQDSWSEIQHPDRRLHKKFQDMLTEYGRKLEKAEQQKREAERERLWLKFSLLHELAVSGRTAKGAISKKTETRVNENWVTNDNGDELENSMDKACRDLLEGNQPDPSPDAIVDMQARARALCIHLEFLAGLPSPEEDREQRMQYQVDRLAGSMSGEIIRQPVAEEASNAEHEWFAMFALPEPEFTLFGKRIKHAIKTIKQDN